MHRRSFLSSVVALSGGCLGRSRRSSPNPTTYELTGLSVTTNHEQLSAKYVVERTARLSRDQFERTKERSNAEPVVRDVSEIENTERRTVIETAFDDETWRSDAVPDGLPGLPKQVDFFTGFRDSDEPTYVEFTLYRFRPDQPPAVTFDASVVDDRVAPDDPGELEFEVVNESSRPQFVPGGAVPPFGVVGATAIGDDDGFHPDEEADDFLLWNDDFQQCVAFSDRGMEVCSTATVSKVEPSERVSRRYEVLPPTTSRHPEYTAPSRPGAYRADGHVPYRDERGRPRSMLSFEVAFSLERRKRT